MVVVVSYEVWFFGVCLVMLFMWVWWLCLDLIFVKFCFEVYCVVS